MQYSHIEQMTSQFFVCCEMIDVVFHTRLNSNMITETEDQTMKIYLIRIRAVLLSDSVSISSHSSSLPMHQRWYQSVELLVVYSGKVYHSTRATVVGYLLPGFNNMLS